MNAARFRRIVGRYGRLKVVVAGDFCLDRYLHIDPALEETSLETRLPAHQVVQVRPQAGGAGNVLANVAALGPEEVRAVGVCGFDGEGRELCTVLRRLGAKLKYFIRSRRRLTFTYTKPLVIRPNSPPEELSRLDIRDRTPMPAPLVRRIIRALSAAMKGADAVILMEQVAPADGGVLSPPVKEAIQAYAQSRGGAKAVFLADSRSGAGAFTGVCVKVNREELRRRFPGDPAPESALAARWAGEIGRCVFVTLGPDGMIAAEPTGRVHRASGIAVSGPIDIVGAGDTVLAHLGMALAAGASPGEAIQLANAAGSVVVRKLGTTGTATVEELRKALKKG